MLNWSLTTVTPSTGYALSLTQLREHLSLDVTTGQVEALPLIPLDFVALDAAVASGGSVVGVGGHRAWLTLNVVGTTDIPTGQTVTLYLQHSVTTQATDFTNVPSGDLSAALSTSITTSTTFPQTVEYTGDRSYLKTLVTHATSGLTRYGLQVARSAEVSAEDDLLTGLIGAAHRTAETVQRRALLTKTLRLNLDDFPCGSGAIYLPCPPLQSVSSIGYWDADGDTQTLPSTDYHVDAASKPARILPRNGTAWPSVELNRPGAVQVNYTAGSTSTTNIPRSTVTAMKLLCADWYENREGRGDKTQTDVESLPRAAAALLGVDWQPVIL